MLVFKADTGIILAVRLWLSSPSAMETRFKYWLCEPLCLAKLLNCECNALPTDSAKREKAENNKWYQSSKQWLAMYSLEARKLNLYDILSGL